MPWQSNGGGDKNPWGAPGGRGGGGGQQPPDVDELIARFQDWLKGLLPGGMAGPVGILVFLFLAYILFQVFTFRVEPGEEGVVLRFGKWTRTEPPGLHPRWPYPVEMVIYPDVQQQRRVDVGFHFAEGSGNRRQRQSARVLEESLMLTGDENIVEVAFTVFWRIREPKDYLFNIQEPQEATVKAVAESAMREVIGRTPIQFALTEGRDQIQQETHDIIQRTLDDYGAGISITEVNLERVDPPQQVIDAFRDVQAAEADRQRFQNEAEAYANSIIPEARGQAAQIVRAAEAYKEQVIATATGDASRFMSVYEEYRQARDVTRKRIYLETMEEILAGMNKIILDDKAGSGVVPYLPLPEIQRRQQQGGGQSDE